MSFQKGTENLKKFELKFEKFIQIVFPDNNSTMVEILISPLVADHFKPIVVDDDTYLTLFDGKIVQKDGQYEVVPTVATSSCPSKSRVLFGTLDPNQFIDELKLQGLTDAKLEVVEDGKRYLVYFVSFTV